MSGFSNSIVGGAETLIRSAIKSLGFVTGITGWRIAKNGTAEFNDVIIRGFFQATSPSGSEVLISADVSSAFIEFQPPNITGIIFEPGSITTTSAPIGTDMIITGPGETSPTNVTSGIIVLGADNTIPASTVDIVADLVTLSGTVRYSPYNVDGGKGWLTGIDSLGTGSGITTETVMLSLNNYTFKANRTYRIDFIGEFLVSVAPNRPQFRLRKTNAAGQELRLAGKAASNTNSHDAGFSGVFTIGINDVTAVICATVTNAGGGFTVNYGNSTRPMSIDVWDIGAASAHPNAIVLV